MWIITKFNEGGIFMYAILAFGILTITFIVERYSALFRNLKDPNATFRQQLLAFIAQGDARGAAQFAQTQKETAIARIAHIGTDLRANGAGDEEVQARMDEALSQEIQNTDRRTGFLAMFGNVATLLGLLGTISGMIHSFAAVASANPADRATMLSQGISEAMNCTAFGLLVAIPALVAYAVFQNRTDRYVTALTGLTTEIFHDLLFLMSPEETTATSNRKTTSSAITASASVN